ncbi:MAG: HNH endonuclease [Oscillospiraceae bacterium]|nr:HNH endonuclease [Oscillospiraceae bacterium]
MSEFKRNTGIDNESRREVHERDGHRCVYCGRTDKPVELAHYVSRVHGGKGVPRNLITLCIDCHRRFDGSGRGKMKGYMEDYLKSCYPDWNEREQIYRRR